MGEILTKCCDKETFNVKIPKDSSADRKSEEVRTTGEISKRQSLISLNDFVKRDVLGEGGYGKVFLVEKKDNKNLYALKKVKKKLFQNTLRLKDAINEKNIMVQSSHPFIVKLFFTFQDDKNLYYCMEYVQGGVLFTYIKEQGYLSENVTKFYIAQVILALKYLHEECGIIYRDLKPENLLMDNHGYIKLSDFGLSTSRLRSGRRDK